MVIFVNSVQFKINENVLDFILANKAIRRNPKESEGSNNKYNFFINSNYKHELIKKR